MIRLEYQSLVEVGNGPADIWRIQHYGTNEEKDLFGSLRRFQLRSSVIVEGARRGIQVDIRFALWKCDILDRYDWKYDEYLTVFNPDFGSRSRDAVRPMDDRLTVYHSNAKRLEDAHLAAPYDVRSIPWDVHMPEIVKPAIPRI